MRGMKDSGILWEGEIPDNWKPIRLKDYYNFEKGRNAAQYTQEYMGKNAGKYPVYSGQTENDGIMGEISSFDYDISECLFTTTVGAKVMTLKILSGKFSLSQNCLIMLPKQECNNKFVYYMLVSLFDYEKLLIPAYMQPSLRIEDLKKYSFFAPSIEGQKKIAIYLDAKCAEIDTLTADIEAQIETLEQYKRSVITEAVTKGLNPNVEMKDSGIEWIGEIPAHWKIHPIYYYFGERKHKNSLGLESNLLSLSYGNIIQKNINSDGGLLPESFNTYNIVEPGDIIIRPTDLQNDKHSLRTGFVKEHGIITSAYIALKPIKSVNTAYYHYLLHAYDVMKVFYNMGNGVRQGVNFSEFSCLMVFEPTRTEQDGIVAYLDAKCAEIDSIIADKQTQLETLTEYKKSLIYEYVTGKKEVPTA